MSDIVELARERAISYRDCGPSAEHTAAMLNELASHVERLRAELDAAKAELVTKTDELAAAWMVKDDLLAELAKVREQRDEAHSLIRTWKVNLVDVVDDGEIMYAMTSEGRCSMPDAHKRAFLAATAKEGGGA